jgi:TolB protein
MNRSLFFLFLLFTVSLTTATSDSHAAGFVIHVGPGQRDFPLALPRPEGDSDPADALWTIVKRDLAMTGYFQLIDPDAFIDQSGNIAPGEFNFADWRLLRAAALAKTSVTVSGEGLVVDLYLYDVHEGTPLLGKRLKSSRANANKLAHKVAAHIVRTLTGTDSFFDQTLVVVGKKTGNKEIYLMDIDGSNARRVTKNGSINLSPAWSPSAEKIAWTSYKRNNPDLYVKNLKSGHVRALSTLPGLNIGAAFSPDGARIALTRSRRGDSDIYIVDADTGNTIQRVTTGGGIDISPSFSPDGTQLAFASERSGGSQIFVTTLSTGATRRVSRQGSFNVDPVWSPDGTKLAFVGRDPRFDIFVLDMVTQKTVRITQNMKDNEDPSWSPDGRYLVFSSTRTGRQQIWLSTADGEHQVPVTPSSSGWSQPVWAPR